MHVSVRLSRTSRRPTLLFAASRKPSYSGGIRRCARSSPGATGRRGRSAATDPRSPRSRRRARWRVTRKPGADGLDRLMVPAVHLAGIAADEAFAHQPRQERILLDPDFVRQVVGLMLRHGQAVVHRAWHLRRDVLHERAASRDVQDLHAAADAEDRAGPASRAAAMRPISNSSRAGIDFLERRMRRLAVSRRIDVAAARQEQAVDAGERLRRRARRVEDADLATGVEDRPAGSLQILPARGRWQSAAYWVTSAMVLQSPSIRGRASSACGSTPPRPRASVSARSSSSLRIGYR